MTFEERNKQEKLLYEAFKGIKYRNHDEQRGLEADFLSQFTDTAIHMIISQMISKGVRVAQDGLDALESELHNTIAEIQGYLEDDDYDDLEQHDCRISIESYQNVLNIIKVLKRK